MCTIKPPIHHPTRKNKKTNEKTPSRRDKTRIIPPFPPFRSGAPLLHNPNGSPPRRRRRIRHEGTSVPSPRPGAPVAGKESPFPGRVPREARAQAPTRLPASPSMQLPVPSAQAILRSTRANPARKLPDINPHAGREGTTVAPPFRGQADRRG